MMSLKELQGQIRSGGQFNYVFFWGHRPRKDGSIGASCLSQWYSAPFSVEGVRFLTAEHYMMAEKARLFGDKKALREILAAQQPNAAKALGRSIPGFQEDNWTRHRFDFVLAANHAKFSQNPELRAYLLGTGDSVLVEASPVDKIWGIGLAADDERSADPFQWKGLNLLGFALMEVRERLKGGK